MADIQNCFILVELKPGLDNRYKKLAGHGILGTGNQSPVNGPNHITHMRINLAGTAWQAEGDWQPHELTREHQAQAIWESIELEYPGELTYQFVLAQTVITIYAEGGTLAESRAAADADIAANREEWEEVI